MNSTEQSIAKFVDYARTLKGDEKGEAQVFCDRLFQAFGHGGYKEAGATLEDRVKTKGKSTKFADLVWKPRLLLEMKKRGENLQNHIPQAYEYWLALVPHRPRYVLLCNFDEFWIYDFDLQYEEPIDKVALEELPRRYQAFNFLLPIEKKPLFKNNRISVTRNAANAVTRLFKALHKEKVGRERAQRFMLQCVVAMFSEDAGLLPSGLFTQLVKECLNAKDTELTYDLLSGLFNQMNNPVAARGGRFKEVPYFNGGLFNIVDLPEKLTNEHLNYLDSACVEDWSKVQPAIFGTLFQDSMDAEERHALGAHFTSEADVQKIVVPTIVRPWQEKIEAADSFSQLQSLHEAMLAFHVLDAACGGGNFLYGSYRELKRLETQLLERMNAADSARTTDYLKNANLVGTRQFFGIDTNAFSVELAKVTLMIAKELTVAETQSRIAKGELSLPLDFDKALPLDNLDKQIVCDDALFCDWPRADAIIGNPPYQSKNKMQKEFGAAYVNRVRERYPQVPGRADFCVYWFRRAHDELAPGGRAGLVGTNTVRQNYSREGGLDYIVANGGTITDAVATQVWSGDAAVHVSIVNWIKGEDDREKTLMTQLGDKVSSEEKVEKLGFISSSLSSGTDVSAAVRLRANQQSGACYQGQTHGHEGFLLAPHEAAALLKESPANSGVLFPYFIADDLLGNKPPLPGRYVIDFGTRDIFAAQQYAAPFKLLQSVVLPTREAAAKEETKRNAETLKENAKAKVNHHHKNFLNKWWQLSYGRGELMEKLASIPRYIACGQVTKRPIFEFVDSQIHPNAALQVFPLPDDYSFGILQSGLHWVWFTAKCSTLEERPRYTSDSVFDTFVWPQSPAEKDVRAVADASVALRALRRDIMQQHDLSLRELYRTLESPGDNPLRKAQENLDASVRRAYGMAATDEPLAFLLALNSAAAGREANGDAIIGPGLPPFIKKPRDFISDDCISMPQNP